GLEHTGLTRPGISRVGVPYVDPAVRLLRQTDHGLDSAFCAHVRSQRDTADLRSDAINGFAIDIADHDHSPFGREAACDSCAQAVTRSGDHRHLPRYFHSPLSFFGLLCIWPIRGLAQGRGSL